MTVGMNIVGLVPVMIDTGVGSDVAKRIAAPLWGGLISLTILTLAARLVAARPTGKAACSAFRRWVTRATARTAAAKATRQRPCAIYERPKCPPARHDRPRSWELTGKPGLFHLRSFLGTPAGENYPTFSPDGRWIAYHRMEADTRTNIYVSPSSGPGSKWRISTEGGSHPQWSPTARERASCCL